MQHDNTLYIRNMVCPRCIRVVREELEGLGLNLHHIELGVVVLSKPPDDETRERVKKVLESNGFELIEDRKKQLIENIKHSIIELIYNGSPERKKFVLSKYLSRKLGFEYNYLSTVFSSVENMTIERYFILQKIERVKELLKYEELTLSEIAYRLNYSSVQHLSRQFKQVTGLTPSRFKQQLDRQRIPIDRLG